MMTWVDFYDTAVALSLVGLIAVAVGWSIDRWPEWRARNEAFRFAANIGWSAVLQECWRPAGTVHNPSDPSPTPRRSR